jgi:threonine synthase
MDAMKKEMFTVSISDEETLEILKMIKERHEVLLEPHGSVGWAGLRHYFHMNQEDNNPEQVAVCLETAHPAKFPKEIHDVLKIDPELPQSLKGLEDKEEQFIDIENNYNTFKQFLKANY